jgi:inhibitor of cysteine peptidase
VIGIGKDTVPPKDRDFAWYQGVKLSLLDVTDVNNPKELSKYIKGDRGTHSLALDNPHAFLFSWDKNLLVIPILLAEIDEAKYPGGYPP